MQLVFTKARRVAAAVWARFDRASLQEKSPKALESAPAYFKARGDCLLRAFLVLVGFDHLEAEIGGVFS